MDWLFQCNPKRYDLAGEIERGRWTESWSMNQGRGQVSVGDRVFLWQTGHAAGLLAVARVVSPVYEQKSDFGDYHVNIELHYKVVPPLSRTEILSNETLARFTPFRGVMGTNFRISDEAVTEELSRILAPRLQPLGPAEMTQRKEGAQQALDAAIKRSQNEIERQIREQLSKMKPFEFEKLVGALLVKLDYREVKVTSRTGDGGVDVRAVWAANGVASLRTCVQVKRQTVVGRPVVQNLRGSLAAGEIGVLVTSGEFTDGAKEEASQPDKIPITLINGWDLTRLLMEHEIGCRKLNVLTYNLKPDDLTASSLEAILEQLGEGEP